MLVFSYLAGLAWGISFILMVVGTALVLYRRRSDDSDDVTVKNEPISILKPLKGKEVGLKGNLRSFFRLDYPQYEVIFSISDPQDPARRVVESLIEENPEVDARLIVAGARVGKNPKVNNLYTSYKTAKYDLLLISDSNARVKPSYLAMMANAFQPGVGLVTSALAGHFAIGWEGLLEANYLNSFLNRWIHLSYLLRHPLVMGKSMLFRRAELEKLGGLSALADHIAEDYAAGRLMKQAGLEVVLVKEPVTQHVGNYRFSNFWSRHVRWGRIRKSYSLSGFLTEPASSALVSGFLGALVVARWFGAAGFLAFFGIHALIWSIADMLLIRANGEKLRPRLWGIWWLFELLTIPLWLHTLLGRTIEWRGARLKLGRHGQLVEASVEDRLELEPTFYVETQPDPIFSEKTQEISRHRAST